MADILASVSVVLGAEVSQFQAAMATARRELKGLQQFAEGMKGAGDSLTRYLTLPLVGIGAASVAASAKMESLKKGLEAISGADLGKQGITGLAGLQLAAQQAGDRLKVLEVIAKAPGIGFEQAVQGDIRLRAVGISATQSAKSLKEFANAVATTGGGASEFDRVTTQLAQLSAKGKVLSQDLRPIIEAAPSVSQALLKLYGTIDSETISASLAKQGKSSTDFIAVLTDELAKLPRVTGGLANALENLQQTAVQSAAKVGDGISKALNLPRVTEGLANGIERLGNGFAGLAPDTQKMVVGLGVAAAAVGPVLVGLGTLGAAIVPIKAGLATLGLATAEAFAPVALIAAGVAVAAVVIIDHWDDITAYFSSSGEGGRVFGDLAASVTNSIGQISDAFSSLNGGGNFGDLVSATGVLKAVFRDLAVGVTAVSNVIGGAIGGIVSLLSGDLPGAAAQGQRALIGLVQPLANVFGFQLRLAEATQGVKEKFDALAVATPGLAALLTKLNNTTPFPIANLGGITRTLGLLENLKQQLKEVQEQRDKETNVASITADNARIISLQKQIAALEGTDKVGKKAADAIAKLRLELSRLTALDNLLGDSPSQLQVLERRAATLVTGLKGLVDAGVSPAARAFQGFEQDLVRTSQAADKLLAGLGKNGQPELLNFQPAKLTGLVPTTIGDTLPQDVARLLGDYAKQAKPFELPLAVRLNMQAIVEAQQPVQLLSKEFLNLGNSLPKFDGLVSKDLKNELLSLGAAFREISGAQQLGIELDAAGAKASALQSSMRNLLAGGLGPASEEMKKLAQEFKNLAFSSQVAAELKASIMDLAGGIATAFSDSVSGLQSFGASLASTLLSTVGDLAVRLGNIILASGLGIQALEVSLKSFTGLPAIAAGLGLLAIGGIAKGAVTNLGKGAGAASGPVSSPTVANYGQRSNQMTIKVEFGEMRLRGQDLVAVGRQQTYRSKITG